MAFPSTFTQDIAEHTSQHLNLDIPCIRPNQNQIERCLTTWNECVLAYHTPALCFISTSGAILTGAGIYTNRVDLIMSGIGIFALH